MSPTLPTHHFGRGGAGNTTRKDPASPSVLPATTPTLKSGHYTTGRGGTGNIVKNEDAETARMAQDVDVPHIMLNEDRHHTGRGGAANVYTPTEEERLAAQTHNENVRRESFRKEGKPGLKGLAEKGKELLTGKSREESK